MRRKLEFMNNMKKKVGILTLYHNNTNFGATLQAFALQQKIKELGYDAYVIDFIPEKLSARQKIRRLIFHPWRLSGIIFRYLGISGFGIDLFEKEWNRLWKKKWNGWQHFCCQYINVTTPVSECNLPEKIEEYDILLTGSDQVWNPSYCTEAHFLPFDKQGKKKVAYAASISRSSLNEEQKDIFKKWLPDVDYITVRENEGKKLLESFLDVKVDVVLDPTLLLTADDWSKVAEPIELNNQVLYRENVTRSQNFMQGYILFVALGINPLHRKFATRVAARMNMKIVIISTCLEEMRTNFNLEGDELVDVTPGQYLSLIREASFVITDSFHCMVFSIIFHRNFVVLKRNPDTEIHNMNSRLYTLLDALGLEEQLVDLDAADKIQLKSDLYEGVDEKMDFLRQRSDKILEQMLNDEK